MAEIDDSPEMAALRRASKSLEVGYTPANPKKLFATAIPVVPEERRPETPLDRVLRRGGIRPRVANKTYVIRCGPFVKIGMAVDVEARFLSIQACNPYDLEMVAILPGGRKVERSLHLRFAPFRHPNRIEWFREEGAVADWIRAGCPMEAGDA